MEMFDFSFSKNSALRPHHFFYLKLFLTSHIHNNALDDAFLIFTQFPNVACHQSGGSDV